MKKLAYEETNNYIKNVLAKGQTIVLYDEKYFDIWFVDVNCIYNNGDDMSDTYLIEVSYFDIETRELIQEGIQEVTSKELEEILKTYGEIIAYL